MRLRDRLHRRIVAGRFERLPFVDHVDVQLQLAGLGDRRRQFAQLGQSLLRVGARPPAQRAGQPAKHRRAVEVVACLHRPHVDALRPRQGMQPAPVQLLLVGGDALDQIADESNRVFAEWHVSGVGSPARGGELDLEDHGAHAHHPQLVPALADQNPVAADPAAFPVLDQGQGAVLSGLRLFVAYDGGEPEVAGQGDAN